MNKLNYLKKIAYNAKKASNDLSKLTNLKKNRVYPDNKHAFSFEELEKIKENYMYYSKLNKNIKIKNINIFNNGIKK